MNILAKNEYQIFLSLVIQYVKYSFTPNLILGTKKLVAWIVDLVAKRVDRALNTISSPPTTIGNIYFVYKILIRFKGYKDKIAIKYRISHSIKFPFPPFSICNPNMISEIENPFV